MRVLLDTHSFIWLVTDDPKLSDLAKSLFLDGRNELFCSAVTSFEIAIKVSLGKLELAEPPREFMETRLRRNALRPLPITLGATPTASPTCRFIIATLSTDCWSRRRWRSCCC